MKGKSLNLESSVGRGKDTQDIGVHGETEKRVVTLLVMSAFSVLPGAPRACVDFRDPTEDSRLKTIQKMQEVIVALCVDMARTKGHCMWYVRRKMNI